MPKTINNEQSVIKTDVFQTIAANIRQEISQFNLRCATAFFHA